MAETIDEPDEERPPPIMADPDAAAELPEVPPPTDYPVIPPPPLQPGE